MTNYANGDTGSDRAYEYEQERDAAERDAYEEFCKFAGLDPDTEEADDAYQSMLEASMEAVYADYWQHEQDMYAREAEEEMLGRPLFPNEY